MTPARDDTEYLVGSLREGDEDALGSLLLRYRGRLQRDVDQRMDARMRGRLDASDVVQEAYLDASHRIGHFLKDDNVPFFIWLRQVTRQTLIDLYRRHLRSQRRDVRREVGLARSDDSAAAGTIPGATLAADGSSPSQSVVRSETRGQIRAALSRLEPRDREVLELRHFQELTNQQVAQRLGVTQATASIRYVRALQRLKHALPAEVSPQRGLPAD